MTAQESVEQKALDRARKVAAKSSNWIEFHNALFGIGGIMGELFPSQTERTRFSKTHEYQEICKMMESMQGPEVDEYSGNFALRLPKSLHKALAEEAKIEGVSLNQLCVAKLASQLRSVVSS
ncbi:HicB family protein [Thalassoglobus neptunius]|uniref:HicB family protein n=1 Tax=Thalassoglobus neptunius TaxID=1938619 RepID=A0A5C5X795_9PLAN|nr:toxin-antitoxin system HicB family antitoxin [Thalassoglobus neptunius]TWT58916.1 HicB family protein [Thalassoglobus neptunius]